jgi:hypothetical protein
MTIDIKEVDFEQKSDSYFYTSKESHIRFKIVEYKETMFGGLFEHYRFEIFKRPYLFGLIGKKKWLFTIQTNGFTKGLSFSQYLLNKVPLNDENKCNCKDVNECEKWCIAKQNFKKKHG